MFRKKDLARFRRHLRRRPVPPARQTWPVLCEAPCQGLAGETVSSWASFMSISFLSAVIGIGLNKPRASSQSIAPPCAFQNAAPGARSVPHAARTAFPVTALLTGLPLRCAGHAGPRVLPAPPAPPLPPSPPPSFSSSRTCFPRTTLALDHAGDAPHLRLDRSSSDLRVTRDS